MKPAWTIQSQNALKTLKGFGKDIIYASPELIQQARALDPQAVEEMLQAAGDNHPVIQAMQGQPGWENPSNEFKAIGKQQKANAEERAAAEKATFDRAADTMATAVAEGVNEIIRNHIHAKATPDELRELLDHIPHLSHEQLSSVRARLMAAGFGIGGAGDPEVSGHCP